MESCDYKVCGGDSIPFAQWSPETLGAGFVLPFALTNSERLPSALPTGETLPSFAAAAACPNPSHRQTKMGVTRKGCSHFCVEVAGFEENILSISYRIWRDVVQSGGPGIPNRLNSYDLLCYKIMKFVVIVALTSFDFKQHPSHSP